MEEAFNLNEFKYLLGNLQYHIVEAIQRDDDYKGEANELLELIRYLQKELIDVTDEKEFFQTRYEELLPDIVAVLGFVEAMASAEKEDFDEEDKDEEDEYDEEEDNNEENEEDLDEDEDEEEEAFKQEHAEWIQAFTQSPQYHALSERQKEDTIFILEFLCDYLYLFGVADPQKWNQSDVEEICLSAFPRKLAAGIEVFQNIGPTVIAFFNFLSQSKRLKQASQLAKHVKTIQLEIPKQAEDPENWDIAKTFTMHAISKNIDLNDPIQRENFIKQFNTLSVDKKNE